MGLMCSAKTFNCFVIMLSAFFCVSTYEMCSTNLRLNSPKYDACESLAKNCDLGFSDTVVVGGGLGSASPLIHNSFQNVCPDTHLFCTSLSLKASSLGGCRNQCNGLFCVRLAQE